LDCVEVVLEFQGSCRIAVSSKKVAVVVGGEVGRSVEYMRRGTAREHCLVEHRHGLVIRDAGQSQI
jgi:hypothetical protein